MNYKDYQEIKRMERINYKKTIALSIQNLTENQHCSMRTVLNNKDNSQLLNIAPSYLYRVQTQIERNLNKNLVKDELDKIRKESRIFSPEELLKTRKKSERIANDFENFGGIYIVYNSSKKMYYVGQSVRVFDRVIQHFMTDHSRVKNIIEDELPVIYNDFKAKNEFSISLIPLDKTKFSTLDDLEDNAIRAYDSLYPNGYNRNSGNLMVKAHFKNEDYQKVASLLLENIKETNLFSSLTNNKKRYQYTRMLFLELALPYNLSFLGSFVDFLRVYRNETIKRF